MIEAKRNVMMFLLSQKTIFVTATMEVKTLLNLKKTQMNTTTKTVPKIISTNLQQGQQPHNPFEECGYNVDEG